MNRKNPWVKHVKAYKKAHPGITYKKALTQAQDTYTPLKKKNSAKRVSFLPEENESQRWKNKCKQLEQNCPMPSTLEGDDWCDVNEKDVIHTNNYSTCFKNLELLRLIHEGFTALDTSYQVPPLRLKLPRDPFTRQLIPKDVVKQLLLQKETFEKILYEVGNHDEELYFLFHLDDFYETFDKPKYTSSDANPIKLSQALETWLKKYETPQGGLKMYRRDKDIWWGFLEDRGYPIISNGKLGFEDYDSD
jgi:hypothetical protein